VSTEHVVSTDMLDFLEAFFDGEGVGLGWVGGCLGGEEGKGEGSCQHCALVSFILHGLLSHS
jgi:hypothetical protein